MTGLTPQTHRRLVRHHLLLSALALLTGLWGCDASALATPGPIVAGPAPGSPSLAITTQPPAETPGEPRPGATPSYTATGPYGGTSTPGSRATVGLAQEFAGAARGTEIWRYNPGDTLGLGVAQIAAGTVYLRHYGVIALDAATGAELWRDTLTSGLPSETVAPGAILIRLGSELRSLDPRTGKVLWSRSDVGEDRPVDVLGGAVVVYGTRGSPDIAYDAATGEQRWSIGSLETTCILPGGSGSAEGTSAYLTMGSSLYALDLKSGRTQEMWQAPSAQGACISPGDKLALASTSDTLYAFSIDTGAEKWRLAPYNPLSRALEAGSTVYVAGWDGTLTLLNAGTGSADISLKLAGEAPAVFSTGGRIYAGGSDSIYAFDAATRKELWVFRASNIAQGHPIQVYESSNIVYFVAATQVYGLDANTGQPRWTFSSQSGTALLPMAADGVLYLPTSDGTVHAVR